jgi:uncharacterized protein
MNQPYHFLPFRFQRQDQDYLLVNDVGEYHSVGKETFNHFITHELDCKSGDFLDMKAKHMLWTSHLPQTIDLLATQYRSRKRFLYDFTSLHMFVVTRRCNQKCKYCHASSVSQNSGKQYDMDRATARRCVDVAFKSPSPGIKIEFQGGEPLLNFEIVQEIVEYAEEINQTAKKGLAFVICTNLLDLDSSKIDFIKSKGLFVSTSLDGHQEIHDSYRITQAGIGSYTTVTKNLTMMIQELGRDKISALMTITPTSLPKLISVVDEYLKQDLGSIFLRPMNPFGIARRDWGYLGYSVPDFLAAYQTALNHIISINLQGIHFPEVYATLLLTRILTPGSTGFVDLQSPAGVGISGVIYDTNGDVFISDEARMLAHTTGDKRLCLGNVYQQSWLELFGGETLREIIAASCIESLPGCAWCVFQPYCGADPVRNYALYGDLVGKRPDNDFCRKHKGLFNLFFEYLMKKDDDVEDVFWSWISSRNLSEIRGNIHEKQA